MSIELPDDLARDLDADPLPLPLHVYCRRSLEDAQAHRDELRIHHTALVEAIGRQQDERLDEFLTVPQAAVALQMPVRSVYRMIKLGQLESTKVGRTIRVSRSALFGGSSVVRDAWHADS